MVVAAFPNEHGQELASVWRTTAALLAPSGGGESSSGDGGAVASVPSELCATTIGTMLDWLTERVGDAQVQIQFASPFPFAAELPPLTNSLVRHTCVG